MNLDPDTQAELVDALKETWRVLRAAGLHNLTNGVQLGQTSWFVKISDAEHMSDAALAKLPPPVDPDIEEARKLVDPIYECDLNGANFLMRDGARVLVLNAIKLGRSLERGE